MTIEITQENWKPYRVVMVTCVPCVVCRYNHSIGFSVLWREYEETAMEL